MCESTDESYNIAIRYRTVKKRLDNLGYRQPLSLDALPLTEKLLVDLIQTTESLKHFKEIAENNIERCGQSSLSIDPYNYDNTKLVEKCDELHNELLEIKQNNLIQSKDLKRKIQRLESERSDLQLSSSRNLKRIKDLELESSNKSKKIQELLGKYCKPTISNAGLASKKRSAYPLRKPVLESEPLPTENINGGIQYPNLTKVNPQIVDLVSMADRKISSLNHEVIKLKDELSVQTDNIDTLKTQLAMREKEINRLKKLHDAGRLCNVTLKECSCKNEPSCGKCNFINRRATVNYPQSVCNKLGEISEIKILQQAKFNLEQQLRDALDKQHDAMSQAMKLAERNEELEKELRDIDHVALAVEADCNSTVKQNNKRVSQLKEKLENTMKKVRDLENNLLVEKRLSQELRADLEGCKLEKRNIQRTLDNSLEEKKHLTDRLNELTIIENDLNAEIGRLSKHVETQKHALVELELVNDTLKKQTHEETSGENEKKKKVTRSAKDETHKNNNVAASNDLKHSLSSVNNRNTNITNRNGNNNSHGKESGDAANNGIKTMSDDSRKLMDQLERDRDYYKDEWNKLNEKLNKTSDTENAELWSKICDLKHQLNEKEARIAELQRDKRDLCREKLNLENRVQITKFRTRSPCNSCNVCRSMNACVCPSAARISGETSNGSKLMLARLEHERDTARADVERLIEERDILHERLELATEAHTCEQRRLRDRLREIEKKLDEVKAEKQNILITQGSRQSTLNSLEDQLEDAKNELRMVKQELAAQRTQYFQLRALQDQTDQALGDVQSQLTQSESELSKALDRNKNLDQQQLQMDNQIMELKQEINTLRSNMARLDCEKDQLLINLDEKTEQIAALEREVMMKEQQTIGVDQQLRDLQHKNQICLEQSAEQERQLRNMQMEMENYQRQLNAAVGDREHAIRENKRLQNDLAAVTCETRTLQRELQASNAESFDLKRQLQTYVSEVRRAEELLNKKENERTEMLNHFRSLSLEASVLENNNQSLESEAAEAKGALQSTRDRLIDLEGQLADKECQIRRYETQIKELSENVASLEIQVRQQIELREGMELDSNALRDLCVKLDAQKDSLQEELNNCAAIKVRYESQMSKLEIEQKAASDQRNRDRAAIDSLEKLLEQETRNSMECRRLSQELQNEISRLKERVSDLQTKLSAESAKLRGSLNQAAEYDKQIADLRRKVTDEKFNRAQIEEEHRRVNPYNGEMSVMPTEYSAGEPVKGISQTVTFDPNNATHELSQGSLRPSQALMGQKESTRSINAIHKAEATNRFEPGIGLHKDIHMKVSESNVPIIRAPAVGEPAQSIAISGSGPIVVKTIVEEDANYKDIRLQITEQPIMSKQSLHTDDATAKNQPVHSTNSERKVTSASTIPIETQAHESVNLITDEEKKEREKIPSPKANQIENDVLLKSNTTDNKTPLILDKTQSILIKSNTTDDKKPLIIDKTQSKLSFHDLLATQKLSNTNLVNEKQSKAAVDDKYNDGERREKLEKKQKHAETQVSEKKKRKDSCGCNNNNPLSGCIAREQKEKTRVDFELNNGKNKNDDDEGYNTSRISKSPATIVTPSNAKDNLSKDNLSLAKQNVPPTAKVSDSSQSPTRKVPVPVTITYPGSKPVKINLEDSESVTPSEEFFQANMRKNLMEVKKMARDMHTQVELLNDLNSNYISDINNNNDKQKNKVRLESDNFGEFTSSKSQSGDKSNKKQISSKRLDGKSSRSVITYSDKTKIDYPSDDENGERCKISRSRTLALQSNVPRDKQHTQLRKKNTSEKGSSVSDEKSRKINTEETDRRLKSPRSRIKDVDREENNRYDEHRRNCRNSTCLRCFPRNKSSTRSSSRRLANAQTQSSQTRVEAGTSYSFADTNQSSSRDRRQNKMRSPEHSISPRKDRPKRSKFCDVIIKGPAKCFAGSSSSYDQTDESSSRYNKCKTVEVTRNVNEQYRSRSRPSTRERVTRQSQSSSAKSTAGVCTLDTCHEKF